MANELKPQIVNPQIQPQQLQPQLPIAAICQPGQDFEVMFTVLPNGIDAGKLRFSVLVSPRLKPACDTTLGNYPGFLDWPNLVRTLAFQLFLEGPGAPIPAQPLYNPAALDSNLWKAIFKPTSFVRGFKFDPEERTNPIKHYILPLRERNFYRFQLKQDIYQNLAVQSPTKLPEKNMLLDRLGAEGAGIVQKVPSRIPGKFEYQMGPPAELLNPMVNLLNIRDKMIQREFQQFQQQPGGQVPGGGIIPGGQITPGGGQMTPGGPMAPGTPQMPGMQMGPGTFQGGKVFQRGVGPGAVSARKVPRKRDAASIQAATGMSAKQYEFQEYRAFAYKPDQPFVKSPLPGVNDWKNIIDFHQIVGSLADYPEVMRRLGLILDFVVPDASLPPKGAISVRTTGLPPEKQIAPKTRYDKASGFRADVGENPDLQDGLLKFGRKDPVYNLPLYDVVPGDVEGAMAKITNFTRTLLNTTRSDDEEDEGLPALRSGGLSVAHAERDIWLDMLMDSQRFLNEELKVPTPPGQPRGSNIHLLAENLIRGFRIDVRSRPVSPGGAPAGPWGPWRSLNERLGFYYVSAGAPIWNEPIRDEGWVSLGLAVGEGTPVAGARGIEEMEGTTSEQSEPGVQERGTGPMAGMTPQQTLPIQQFVLPVIRPLLVYESLFRWVGWGLSVPRPYRPLQDPGVNARCAPRPDPNNGNIVACSPIPGLNFMAGFLPVPGTLPRLRFGRQYQFRARIVDLAGNSRLLTDPINPAQELPFVTSDKDGFYDRFEPVASPAVVLTRPMTGAPIPPQVPQLGPGGKPLGPGFPGFPKGEPLFPGECVNNLIIRAANVEQPAEPKAGPEHPISERHIVPPQVSAEMSEAHGMFDAPGKDAYQIMISHDSTLSEQFPTPPGAGDFYIDSMQRPFFTVPYLPDPMSVGANLVIYAPGTDPDNGYLHQQPFVGAWPDLSSFRLMLKGGLGNPQFNNGILEVPVPIGEERLVRLGSFIKPGDERFFGIWRWIIERANPQQLAQLLQKVVQGRHWMITPWQPLRLIHAVQQPVLTPQWVCLQVLPEYSYGQPNLPACADTTPIANAARQRRLGQTTATIDATMVIHRPSTMSLDLVAGWREPVDRGLMKSDQEDPERKWLYLDGKSSPFAITISYAPEAVRVATLSPGVIQAVPMTTGPVFKRGLPGETPAEGEAEAIPEEHRTRILQDAHELPVESEVRPRGVPEEGSQAPGEMGSVQERGTMGVAPLQQAQIQKAPPIIVQPQQPKGPQGPPAFDETPFRCAPGAPPPPPAPPQGIPAVQFRFQGLHRFGDTRYRCVHYKVKAMSRYRHLFRPLPVEEELPQVKQNPPRFTRESPWLKADILSTAPPNPPKVLYIVPTFKWETTPQGKRRTGGGLRVYLDRPWFSSGDGERLAVILYPDPRAAEIPDYAVPYVSQWGLDPLWQKGPQTGPPLGGILAPIDPRLTVPQMQPQMPPVQPRGLEQGMVQVQPGVVQKMPYGKIIAAVLPPPVGGGHPAPEHFLNEDHVRYDLGISEVQLPLETVGTRGPEQQFMAVQMQPMAGISVLATRPMPVTICAFNVHPDPSRQLWYSDIEMNPGAEYYPFVRLALARYQVNSVRGAHLSKVVVADFAQLLPERAISAVSDPKNPSALLVSVSGVIGYAAHFRKTVLEATVEEANPNVQGELSWTPVPNMTVDADKWQFAGNNQRTASVPLPTAGAGKAFRLIVKEFEEFIDDEVDETGNRMHRAERRLVYADILPVQGQLGLSK